MKQTGKLVELLDRLIAAGEKLELGGKYGFGSADGIQDKAGLRDWSNELILFKSLAGPIIEPWSDRLTHDGEVVLLSYLQEPLSALKTIRYAIGDDLLVRYEDLVIADTIGDLVEQANYLLEQGFFLAAGVIYRALLEERLRLLCERNHVPIDKAKPTINDYNLALYKPEVFDKGTMLHVTAMAADGNDAAHNDPGLTAAKIERLRNNLTDFLTKFS